MTKSNKLERARTKLQRKLARGWERAVFSAPQRPDETSEVRVSHGPGPLAEGDPRASALFEALWQEIQSAAADGQVKQTFVLDDRRRIELDTRHGHLKQRELDAQKVAKVMGGKQRPLRPDRSARLLRAIGIMNPDGTISARNAKKYKQVNHLVELCRPLWAGRKSGPADHAGDEANANNAKTTEGSETKTGAGSETGTGAGPRNADAPLGREPLRIVDLACGNSYLSFVLLEALRLESIEARLLGVDRREDVIASSRTRARELDFDDRAQFEVAGLDALSPARLSDALGGAPSVAISLHACDTATDEALTLAIRAGVEWIFAVPCCQAELARQLDERGPSPSAALPPAALGHGLLRRGLGEVLTDALRVELLEACGYEVSVVEFVSSAHTSKNLLLRARRARALAPAQWRLGDVRERCATLGVDPALLRSLLALV